jgi:DNA replication factor GINS
MFYDELYEIWKNEKVRENEIQLLPNNIYSRIAVYIKKMKEENRMLDRKTTKAKLLENEFKNAKIMVGELFLTRYRKFQSMDFGKEIISKNALTEEEKKLYGEVSSFAEVCHVFYKDLLRGRLLKIGKGGQQRMIVLRFVKEIPALVGADMKTYGPFNPEDIATLPPENARILMKQGVAVQIDPN